MKIEQKLWMQKGEERRKMIHDSNGTAAREISKEARVERWLKEQGG